MAWQFLLGVAVALALTVVFRPKPQNVPPAGLEDLDLPQAREGAEIGVLFGCRDLRGANVVSYFNLQTKRIKAKGGKK